MTKEQLYKKFARYYDKIYSNKNYKEEVEFIEWAVAKHKKSKGKKLLDVACGTGSHVLFLKNNFSILGVDINHEMLKIARKKVPDVDFTIGDMKKLDLKQKFDVVICMFSAIHYNTDYKELERTLKNFYEHLKSGGVLIFDLSFNRENWIESLVSVDTMVDENLKLARISQSRLKNDVFNVNFVFLVKENGKFDFDIDHHEIGVFETEKVLELMKKIGFKNSVYADFTHRHWKSGLNEKPIFVGVKKDLIAGEPT